MTTTSLSLRSHPAFSALTAHHAEIAGAHLRDLFASDPGRGTRLTADAAGLHLDYSKNRVTDETLRLLLQLAAETGVAARRDAMFAGERINVTEDRAGAARRAAHAARPLADRRRPRRRRRRACRARPHGRVRRARALWRVAGSHGQDDHEHREHRHRRLRPRPRHGLPGTAPLQQARPDVPLRLERRRNRLRRGHARPGSRADALHHLLEDIHDARDDDERGDGARVAAGCARGGRVRGREALRRGLDESRGGRASASTRTTRSASGTGSAAATRCARPWACRRCWPSARGISARCWPASTPWTSTSARRRPSATCRC